MKSHCCSASASATECERYTLASPHKLAYCNLFHSTSAGTESKHSSETTKQGKKGAQSIRFESLIQSAVTALYSPVTVSRTFPFPWSFTVSPSFSLAHFSLSLLPLFCFCPSLSPSIHSLACSWTEWASTALRIPVSMAVWASKQVSRIL